MKDFRKISSKSLSPLHVIFCFKVFLAHCLGFHFHVPEFASVAWKLISKLRTYWNVLIHLLENIVPQSWLLLCKFSDIYLFFSTSLILLKTLKLIRDLQWRVANHSYWHKATYQDNQQQHRQLGNLGAKFWQFFSKILFHFFYTFSNPSVYYRESSPYTDFVNNGPTRIAMPHPPHSTNQYRVRLKKCVL